MYDLRYIPLWKILYIIHTYYKEKGRKERKRRGLVIRFWDKLTLSICLNSQIEMKKKRKKWIRKWGGGKERKERKFYFPLMQIFVLFESLVAKKMWRCLFL